MSGNTSFINENNTIPSLSANTQIWSSASVNLEEVLTPAWLENVTLTENFTALAKAIQAVYHSVKESHNQIEIIQVI